MNRFLVCALAVATMGVLTGCGAEPGLEPQEAVDESSASLLYSIASLETSPTVATAPTLSTTTRYPGVLIGKEDPARRATFNAYDAHLAALALATIKCKGFVDPDDYDGTGGVLRPRFSQCPLNSKKLRHIAELLGIQSYPGARGAAEYFSSTWERARQQFPRKDIPVCPSWSLVQTINPPTFENVKNAINGGLSKEYNRFAVRSPICTSAECSVSHAKLCSAGFGSRWWVSGDYLKGIATTDPVWWLDDTEYATDATNPFMTPGYYHAMSYYGALPGSVYANIHREGEYCSKYYAGYHYKVKLQYVHCTPTWVCMTQCK